MYEKMRVLGAVNEPPSQAMNMPVMGCECAEGY